MKVLYLRTLMHPNEDVKTYSLLHTMALIIPSWACCRGTKRRGGEQEVNQGTNNVDCHTFPSSCSCVMAGVFICVLLVFWTLGTSLMKSFLISFGTCSIH